MLNSKDGVEPSNLIIKWKRVDLSSWIAVEIVWIAPSPLLPIVTLQSKTPLFILR
jgi:hypothetical protein